MDNYKKVTVNENKEPQFSKEQILNASKFTGIEKDTLTVLLEDKKQYSLTEIREMLEEFCKKEPKKEVKK